MKPKYHESLHCASGHSACVRIQVAVRIADTYPKGSALPTHTQLQDRFGMSRATAYRWLNALKDARGQTRGAS